jgi:hypothetical protein
LPALLDGSLGPRGQLFLQDPDGEPLAGYLLIGGKEYHPHVPLAELAIDAVAAAEELTGREPHRVG